jgi:hypothetical protein
MLKQFFEVINRVLLLGAKPSSKLSKDWQEEELWKHEHEQDLKAGLY